MERHNKRSGEYPSLTYQKNSQGSGSKHHGHSQRISLGSFNDNLVQGEKRHIKRFNRDAEEDDWEDAEHNDRDTRQRNRRSHHQVRCQIGCIDRSNRQLDSSNFGRH